MIGRYALDEVERKLGQKIFGNGKNLKIDNILIRIHFILIKLKVETRQSKRKK